MSKYKAIRTEFRTAASLLAALKDLNLPYETAPDIRANTLPMQGYGGSTGRSVAVRIPKRLTGGFEDVGFAWSGSAYEAIISTHDGEVWKGHRDVGEGTLKQIKQRYAVHEARRAAAAQGYTVHEQAMPDGTIQITCSHW